MKRVIKSIIGPDNNGKNILDWLRDRFTYLTREQWKSQIKNGHLTVNKKNAFCDSILKLNDEVEYIKRNVTEPEVNKNISKVYEDKDFLVINKPPLLPCHPGGKFFKNTLWYLLKKEYEYFHFSTRLDRETSGLLLITKNKAAIKHIIGLQKEDKIYKIYLVLVHGSFADNLTASGFLRKSVKSRIRKKIEFSFSRIDTDDIPCRTDFKKTGFKNNISLVQAKLYTGRTHQIRATLCSLGYPVVGDKIYGKDENLFLKFIADKLSDADREELILEHQALHSYSLSFPDINGEIINAVTDPPWFYSGQ